MVSDTPRARRPLVITVERFAKPCAKNRPLLSAMCVHGTLSGSLGDVLKSRYENRNLMQNSKISAGFFDSLVGSRYSASANHTGGGGRNRLLRGGFWLSGVGLLSREAGFPKTRLPCRPSGG